MFAGGRVELAKTSATWRLSLENAMACNFGKSGSQGGNSTENDNAGNGLDYEQYVRILLLMCRHSEKYYRTMSQIELWAIRRGCQEFRMNRQICGLEADISFRAGSYKNSHYSVQRVSYGY